jgi:hypothetical protein
MREGGEVMGAKSRRKGAGGEREYAGVAVECGFKDAHRTAPMQAGHPSEYGDVGGIPLNRTECKRYRRVPVNRFAREVLSRETPGFIDVLAWRDDGDEWNVTVRARNWLVLVRELVTLREENIRLRARVCPSAPAHWRDEVGAFDVPSDDGKEGKAA